MLTNYSMNRIFPLFIGIFLMLAFAACDKEELSPTEPNANSSYVEVTYESKKYRIDGYGFAQEQDTTIVDLFLGEDVELSQFTFVISGADNHPDKPVEESSIFGIVIMGYKGPGTYSYELGNIPMDMSYSAVFGITFLDFVNEGGFFFESGQVTIDKDNANELTGSFTMNVLSGPGSSPTCTGVFKIKKT